MDCYHILVGAVLTGFAIIVSGKTQSSKSISDSNNSITDHNDSRSADGDDDVKASIIHAYNNNGMEVVEVLPETPVATASPTRSTTLDSTSSKKKRKHPKKPSFLYSMLKAKSNQWQAIVFKRFITFIIILDTSIFILSTDKAFVEYNHIFHIIEGIVSCIYLIEYIGRLITCVESTRYKNDKNCDIEGNNNYNMLCIRLKYVTSVSAIIDALATFPFFIKLFSNITLPQLTYIRLFRLLRMARTESYGKAVDAVVRVLYYNYEILYVATLICIFLTLITSILLYYFRPILLQNDDINSSNNDEFDSIIATIYLSTLMLTGQGGPDSENLPWYTKVVVLITSLFSVAMFAIPASMLTWGFEAEAQRCAKEAFRKSQEQKKKKKGGNFVVDNGKRSTATDLYDDFSSDSSSSYSSDEEYLRIIAGEDDSDSEDSEEEFKNADQDKDGFLTFKEFQDLQKRQQEHQQKFTVDGNPMLVERIEKLEVEVKLTNQKLDQILQILQQQQK